MFTMVLTVSAGSCIWQQCLSGQLSACLLFSVQEMFDRDEELAGAYFLVQFFVDEFGPEDVDAPLHVLRFLKSTPPRLECQKYAYIPSRTSQCSTHSILPHDGFTTWVYDQGRKCHKKVLFMLLWKYAGGSVFHFLSPYDGHFCWHWGLNNNHYY